MRTGALMGHTEHRQSFSVAYDGTKREDDHTIDAELLAPALLAISRLIREAAAEFGGKETAAQVLVVSDFEHKCFNINFELILQLYEQLKSLLGDEEVRTAKDLLEWIGIIGSLGGISLFGFLKWRQGREIEKSAPDESGRVTVNVKGDNNSIQVTNHVLKLSENPVALKAVRDTFSPIGKNGFDKVEVRVDGELETIGLTDAEAIVESAKMGINEAAEVVPDEEDDALKDAWLSVYSPVFDEQASLWRFRLGTDVIYADVSETTIAADAIARGGASPNDAYNVKLEISKPSPNGRPHFKIVDVMRFVPAERPLQQTSMKLEPPKKSRKRPTPKRIRLRPKPAE